MMMIIISIVIILNLKKKKNNDVFMNLNIDDNESSGDMNNQDLAMIELAGC